jgi:tRNA (mo5U34)-methyltransferase
MMKRFFGGADAREKPRPLPAKATSAQELRARVSALGAWMYRFDLGEGVETALYDEYLDSIHRTRWQMILPELERTFKDRWARTRVLDSACNEGWFSFEVAKLGAKEVIGFDAREENIRKAELVQAQTGADSVTFAVDNIFDVTPERYGMFDLVLCLGLMYHLEDPMGALRRLRSVASEFCVIETEVARAGVSIAIERGPNVGVVDTPEAIAVIAEPEFKWNPLQSVTGIVLVPNLAALKVMMTHAGFRNIRVAEPFPGCASRYADMDRVILFANT